MVPDSPDAAELNRTWPTRLTNRPGDKNMTELAFNRVIALFSGPHSLDTLAKTHWGSQTSLSKTDSRILASLCPLLKSPAR